MMVKSWQERNPLARRQGATWDKETLARFTELVAPWASQHGLMFAALSAAIAKDGKAALYLYSRVGIAGTKVVAWVVLRWRDSRVLRLGYLAGFDKECRSLVRWAKTDLADTR